MQDEMSEIKVEEKSHMTGWKTKLGSFLLAFAGVSTGASELIPLPEASPWCKFVAYVAGGVGTAFITWGMGHKLEKNRNILVEKKRIPYYVHPMHENEFDALETMRKSDLKDRQDKVMSTLKSPLDGLVE